MLGWMLGGRGEHATNAVGDDTAQIDQPDTPAPVFAARAFKSALFGTPAPKLDIQSKSRAKTKPESAIQCIDQDLETPMKQPQGILLTPGTATSRRKRVSFNQDALTTTKSISPFDGPRDGVVKRTRLSDALDKARRKGNSNGNSNGNSKGPGPDKTVDAPQPKAETDSDWEEEGGYDDDYDYDNDNDNDNDNDGDAGAQDFTLDLNEPHSQSGKYWKGEFERYRSEAAAELEKLVKYKQRAKSYAREKDVEAMQLAERLKEEQEKVVAMEKKIAENASQMAAKQRESCSTETAELLATLTQQTALATESRHRVQELEEQLEDLLQGREDDDDDGIRGRRRRTSMPSTATQKTLLETQRELRRARTQLKELDDLRLEVSSLKGQLRRTGQRGAAESAVLDGGSETSLVRELRAQLRQAKEESARKDEGFMQLKLEFEAFRNDSEAHDADARAVLERANAKITDLKKQVKLLKAANPSEASRLRSWQLQLAGDRVSKDDLSVEIPSRRTSGVDYPRRSLDFADFESDGLLKAKARTLREKYQEDETDPRNQDDDVVITAITPAVLADRPDLARPRWQPFVPRSPRNRAHAEGSLTKRVQSGAIPSAKSKAFAFPDLPGLKAGLRSKGSKPVDEDLDLEVDLLQDRFARLGGPESDQERNKKSTLVLSASTRSSRIPPERRAAAIARIEKRMADRVSRREGYDKENMRP